MVVNSTAGLRLELAGAVGLGSADSHFQALFDLPLRHQKPVMRELWGLFEPQGRTALVGDLDAKCRHHAQFDSTKE